MLFGAFCDGDCSLKQVDVQCLRLLARREDYCGTVSERADILKSLFLVLV